MIIKISGVDGCGKSSIIKSLKKYLEDNNRTVYTTSEFGSLEYDNHPVSYLMRTIIDENQDLLDEFELEVLFSLISRRKNLYEIKKQLDNYDYILVDRSDIDNYAYGLAINKEFFSIYDVILKGINNMNSKIFWINTDLDVCLERVNTRNQLTLNEKRGKEYFERVIKVYKKLVKAENCIEINGNNTIEKITETIFYKIVE